MDSYELLKKIKLTGILFFLIALPVLTAGQARSAYIFAGIGNDGYFPDAQGLSTALLETSGWNGTGNNYLHEDLSEPRLKILSLDFRPFCVLTIPWSGFIPVMAVRLMMPMATKPLQVPLLPMILMKQ
jgi:hypothetical protein